MTVNPARIYQEYFGPAIFEPLAEVLLGHATLSLACGSEVDACRTARGCTYSLDVC